MALTGDNPIKQPEEDVFGRAALARNLAQELAHLDAPEGYVVAVMGAWGSGKTSLVNLIRHELAEIENPVPVLDFNPWMFSGSEQLVESFFVELAAQLRIKPGRLGKIADEIAAYGDLLNPLSVVPVVGPWVAGFRSAGAAFKKFQDRRKESVTERRSKLAATLAELQQSIIVVIDDIDRLGTDEIRDIFKLVRLTASFPNIIYLLAFDRQRVEDALSELRLPGRSYLEKIVQLPIDLPEVPDRLLMSQVASALNDALDDIIEPAADTLDQSRWPDVLAEIILPLIHNMRDVRRYAASVRVTMRDLAGRVDLVDILGLEAIRVFLPDVFAAIARAQVALTEVTSSAISAGVGLNPRLQQQINDLTSVNDAKASIVRSLIDRIFPVALRYVSNTYYGIEHSRRWLQTRRVAHGDVLRLYLERTPNEGLLAFADAERAFLVISDEAQFENVLNSIPEGRLNDVITSLEVYESDYPVDAIQGAIAVLMNQLPRVHERRMGLWSLDGRLVVTRVVLRMLRRVTDEAEVERIVTDALPNISRISSRFNLILLVGHDEGAGHQLVSEESAARLAETLATQLYQHPRIELAQDPDLLRMLYWVSQRAGFDRRAMDDLLADEGVTKAVLTSSLSEIRSQGMDTRTVTSRPVLLWEPLTAIYGDEENLRRAIDRIRGAADISSQLKNIIELADRYLEGWRPDNFMERDDTE